MINEVESAVLAGMFYSPENAREAMKQLGHYEFIDPENQAIFDAAVTQLDAGGGVNPLLIKARCGTSVSEETWFLIDDFDGSTSDFKDYVGVLNENGQREQIRKACRATLGKLDEVSPIVLISELKEGIASAEGSISKPKTTHNIARMKEAFLANLADAVSSETEVTGYSTGMEDLDAVTSGLFPGDLVIIAGRPAMGKTTLAMNIAEHGMRNGKRVKVFSFEMPAVQIYRRMIASIGSINMSHLKNGRLTELEAARLPNAVEIVDNFDIEVDDTSGITFAELRRRVLQEHEASPYHLLVIDYLQLMKTLGGNDNKASQIGDITGGLKGLAKDMGIPIILLSQLNRSVEQRPNKRPMMSDLRESGSIEQDADIIMFVYRDEVYNPNSPDVGKAEIIIGKQRSGPTCTVTTKFEGQYSRFIDVPRDQVQIIASEF
ncbi:replicative DNA helicase [Pseudomonas syringae pv. actinidiae]|nr:replicative DNA helicase [Pseudomonas syringae pv. actinidiae]